MIKQTLIKLFLPVALFTCAPMLSSNSTGSVANFSLMQHEMPPLAITNASIPHAQEGPNELNIEQYDSSNWFAENEEERQKGTEKELEMRNKALEWHKRVLNDLQKEDENPTGGITGYFHRAELRFEDLAYRRPTVTKAIILGIHVGCIAILLHAARFFRDRAQEG